MRPEYPCAYRHRDCNRARQRCASRLRLASVIWRFLHPCFKLRIRRLVGFDVISHRLLFESERGKGHRIETFADRRIAVSKFTRRLERDFLPQAREMDNAKLTGNAGTDQWNIGVAHNDVIVTLNNQSSTLNLFESQRREDNSIRLS